MNKYIISLSALFIAASLPMQVSAKEATVSSPDGKISVTLEDGASMPAISISHDGKEIIGKSDISLVKRGRKTPVAIKKIGKTALKTENISAPLHHTPNYTTSYNEMSADLGEGLGITFRVFNDGVAYRFTESGKGEYIIDNEVASYVFPSNPEMILPFTTNDKKPMAMAFQNYYTHSPLDKTQSKLAFLPAAADMGNGVKAVLLESDLESYPGMFVSADSISGRLNAAFAKYPKTTYFSPWRMQEHVESTEDYIAKGKGAKNFPWRIFSITTDDRQMPVSNLVYSLASPSRVADTSWIKPGKVAWDWWNDWGLRGVDFKAGINNETYKYYIDFAAKNGIEYVVLDEGWYVPKSGDMLTVIDDINLQELIDYGKERGVGIVLWTVFNVLDKQLEEACEKYSKMGAKGFKVDFLDRDDQTATEMAYRIAEAAARHNMMLDYHGFYKPSGLNRTYPNIINFEGVFGLEELKWAGPDVDMPQYDVTFPYLRQMSGPSDYTQGAMRNASKKDFKAIYYNPMSQGTRSHQLATYVVFDSPFTMLCDSPSLYEKNQDCVNFITGIPTVFDETFVSDGKLGEYIVTVRRAGDSWFVGGLTNWNERDLSVDFSFLPAGEKFKATIAADGINAAKQGDDYKIYTADVDNNSKINLHLAPGGGFAIRIDPRQVMNFNYTIPSVSIGGTLETSSK